MSKRINKIYIGGQSIAVELTLNKLAKLEAALGASNLKALMAIIAQPSASQLITILRIILKDGVLEHSDIDVENGTVDLKSVLLGIAHLFKHSSGEENKELDRGDLEQLLQDYAISQQGDVS
ncbi:MAG: GTA-gp10 family protein [Pseudomonadota bacterium]